jgi:UDP-3-O-[3-hydroxymyristoyl] glucosamine N-acyltransferase
LLRARSINAAKIAKSLNEHGRDVEIHPSAVVELCVLGDGVKIGPNAVVRGSILGVGARVDPFATVNASVLGAGARIGRYAFCNLCTVYPGAMISQGDGYQVSVFGEDAFVAWGATALDLSFGKTVKVERDGPNSERVDSGHHFVGVAIGHRAVIGNNVRLRFGVSVPNDGMLVDRGDDLLRTWGEAPVGEPVVIQDGHAALFRRD